MKVKAFDKIKKVPLFVHDIRFDFKGDVMDVLASETNFVDDAFWFDRNAIKLDLETNN